MICEISIAKRAALMWDANVRPFTSTADLFWVGVQLDSAESEMAVRYGGATRQHMG